MPACKSIGCTNEVPPEYDFCTECLPELPLQNEPTEIPQLREVRSQDDRLDVFAVLHLFQIYDPSGCIQLASQKLLASGHQDIRQRTNDVKHARDLLTRWLELNRHTH
jgi:hypothetical protein